MLLESEAEIDRLLAANTPGLVVAQIDSDFKEEEMALNQRRSLQDLMASRNKGATSQEVPKSQVPPTLPPPPALLPTDPGLQAMRDLTKKRPLPEIKEGELPPQKGMKHQKTAKDLKDKRSLSVESREEQNQAKVRLSQRVWSPRLEVDGAAIPWNAFIREYQRGHPRMWLSP